MCSTLSRSEPLAGTAPVARGWLMIEQPGPWGRDALTESRLPPGLGRELAAAAAGSGVRLGLIRRPGRQVAPGGGPARRRVFAAHTVPGRGWVATALLSDPAALLDLDFGRLGAGEPGGLWEPYEGDPLVLVCTHGKRDQCCALRGRPLTSELAASGNAAVWETSHLGGHRFAPTLLVLPHGYVYGRMTAVAAKEVVAALHDGRAAVEHCRGRSCWDRPGQIADLAVREVTGEYGLAALTVTDTAAVTDSAWRVTVGHGDGRRWRVVVEQRAGRAALPPSCGSPAEPQLHLVASHLAPLPRLAGPADPAAGR